MRPASDIRDLWSCAAFSFARMAERGMLGSTEGGERERGGQRERERERGRDGKVDEKQGGKGIGKG